MRQMAQLAQMTQFQARSDEVFRYLNIRQYLSPVFGIIRTSFLAVFYVCVVYGSHDLFRGHHGEGVLKEKTR